MKFYFLFQYKTFCCRYLVATILPSSPAAKAAKSDTLFILVFHISSHYPQDSRQVLAGITKAIKYLL